MEVEFLALANDVSTLLCFRDMNKNNLGISIRDSCLRYEKNRTVNHAELQSHLHMEA